MKSIQVILPFHLMNLAGIGLTDDLKVEVDEPVCLNAVVDALERDWPPLRGTIRNPYKSTRRPLVRFFACGADISHNPLTEALPEPIQSGEEPLIVIGAIAGG